MFYIGKMYRHGQHQLTREFSTEYSALNWIEANARHYGMHISEDGYNASSEDDRAWYVEIEACEY